MWVCQGLAHSHWLAVVTMTTVGFGDYTPKTAWGFIIVSLRLHVVRCQGFSASSGKQGKKSCNSFAFLNLRGVLTLISTLFLAMPVTWLKWKLAGIDKCFSVSQGVDEFFEGGLQPYCRVSSRERWAFLAKSCPTHGRGGTM